MFTHRELLNNFKKGFRNGNWRKLNSIEKGFYRAAISYTWVQGKLINSNIVEQLSSLVDKLLESPGLRVLKKGYERAAELLQKYEEEGVFDWAPQLRKWLKDPDYVLWLGTLSARG